MPRIYKLSRAPLKVLYKIRHHKGHGIHSPFVFDLINKVIEEKTPYHLYEDLEFALIQQHHPKLKLKKYNLLSFRLVNYFRAKHILEIGSGYGVNTLSLTAPSNNIVCHCIEKSSHKTNVARKLYSTWKRTINLLENDNLPILDEKQDCIFIDLTNYNNLSTDISQYLLTLVHPKTFIIVKGIRTNRHNQLLWKSMIKIESRTVVLDLFNIGIIFFDPRLYRWNYQISF